MSYPYISRVEIENFRNLHGLKADLPSTVVIVGENRGGKSNLLHALRLVLDPSLPDSARSLRAEDFWDGLAGPFNGDTISIKVEIQGFDGDEDAEAVLADSIVSDSPMIARLTYLFRPQPALAEGDEHAFTEDEYGHVVYGGENEAGGAGRDVRKWLALTVLPAMRDAESQLAGGRNNLLRPLLDRVRPLLDSATLKTVRDDLDQATNALLTEAPLKDLQTRINARVREIVGSHLAVSTKFGFAASDSDQVLRSLRLYLEDGKLRSIADASLGTANVLFLCLLLQDLDDRREKRATAGTVLAIEEPEAHLHPHLQRLLFRYALRRKHAVLVTTHSPHIASVAPLGSLTVLRADSDASRRTSQIFSLDKLELPVTDVADLERYLDVTRAEMLFAKGIILVEGTAEAFLVPAFAAHEMERQGLGSSLDELGITVCSVSGTDFAPYWRVTSDEGWDIPRVIITDGDPRIPMKNGKPSSDEPIVSGLARGARLLRDADLSAKAKSGDAKDAMHVRKALQAAGIFVGTTTLESDLIATMGEEMKAAFSEIHGASRKATRRFVSAIDDSLVGGADAIELVVQLIDETVGKGRFAQRLASKVTADHEAPLHVKRAIEKIFALVPHA